VAIGGGRAGLGEATQRSKDETKASGMTKIRENANAKEMATRVSKGANFKLRGVLSYAVSKTKRKKGIGRLEGGGCGLLGDLHGDGGSRCEGREEWSGLR
jgi:hypothetical protein